MSRRPFSLVLLAIFVSTSVQAREIKSFAFYYGSGHITELSRYDIVVLQPHQYTPDEIRQLKEYGTVVLGYISLGEEANPRRDNGKGPGGYAPWYIDQFQGDGFKKVGADNQPDRNPDWHSLYVDPSNARWQRTIRKEIRHIRQDLKMNGLFADTVSIPSDVFTIETEKRMKKGMNTLVKRLRRWAGGFVMVNNGYSELRRWAPYIDGMVLEANYSTEPNFVPMLKNMAEDIATTRAANGLFVAGLFYLPDEKIPTDLCQQFKGAGFVSAFYPSTPDGRALKTLPQLICPNY